MSVLFWIRRILRKGALEVIPNVYQLTLILPRMASTDLKQAIDSIAKIARIDFDILCCGHGRPLTGDVHSQMWDLVRKIKD